MYLGLLVVYIGVVFTGQAAFVTYVRLGSKGDEGWQAWLRAARRRAQGQAESLTWGCARAAGFARLRALLSHRPRR